MVQFNLHDIFLIQSFNDTEWIANCDRRDLMELVFVEKGSGVNKLPDRDITFEERDLLLIDPRLKQDIILKNPSSFYAFQFTEQLFSNKIDLPDRDFWLRRIDFILKHPSIRLSKINQLDTDQELIWNLIDLIKKEFEAKKDYHQDIISNMVSIILNILFRNINDVNGAPDSEADSEAELIDEILEYIHKNVYKPELTKISALAKTFDTTNSTLSNYFKKYEDMTPRQYKEGTGEEVC